jgi:hypothetical protein
MKLFKFENGVLVLDKSEIALIKEFNAILRRDSNPKKTKAFAEFNYIYQLCDKFSVINQRGLNGKEAELLAKDLSGLDLTYTPDDLVLAAIERYKQLRPSQLESIAKEIRGAFNTSHKVIKAIRQSIEKYLVAEEIKPEDLNNATSALEKLLILSDTIPKRMGALKTIEELIDKEDKDGEVLRGGDEILDSMDPEKAIG